jgi:hypothetical protein
MTVDPTPANAARLAMRCVELEAENEKLRRENEQLRSRYETLPCSDDPYNCPACGTSSVAADLVGEA